MPNLWHKPQPDCPAAEQADVLQGKQQGIRKHGEPWTAAVGSMIAQHHGAQLSLLPAVDAGMSALAAQVRLAYQIL
jgi:hypothetical protein